MDYQPGDSIGIVPENPLATVEAIIALTGVDANKLLTHRNEEISIFNLLKKKLNIVYLPERVVRKYAALVQQEIPETKIGLLNLLKIYPVKDAAQFEEVIDALGTHCTKIIFDLIFSRSTCGEVHLTVAKDNFKVNEEMKFGLCSDLLSRLDTR